MLLTAFPATDSCFYQPLSQMEKERVMLFSSLSNPAPLCRRGRPGSPCFLDHPEVTAGEKDVHAPFPMLGLAGGTSVHRLEVQVRVEGLCIPIKKQKQKPDYDSQKNKTLYRSCQIRSLKAGTAFSLPTGVSKALHPVDDCGSGRL